jgi:hypothetical protein
MAHRILDPLIPAPSWPSSSRRRGGRVVPVAMRLDVAKGRWELVELQ